MPAKEQLKRIVDSKELVNPALKRINGVRLSSWYWSLSEYNSNYAWIVGAFDGGVNYGYKDTNYGYVRCVLAF